MASSVSGQLRKALRQYGTVYQAAKDSGIPQSVLQRFVARKRGLSMESIDQLADFLGLELRPKPCGTGA